MEVLKCKIDLRYLIERAQSDFWFVTISSSIFSFSASSHLLVSCRFYLYSLLLMLTVAHTSGYAPPTQLDEEIVKELEMIDLVPMKWKNWTRNTGGECSRKKCVLQRHTEWMLMSFKVIPYHSLQFRVTSY